MSRFAFALFIILFSYKGNAMNSDMSFDGYEGVLTSLVEASDTYNEYKDSPYLHYPGMDYSIKLTNVVNKLNDYWRSSPDLRYSKFLIKLYQAKKIEGVIPVVLDDPLFKLGLIRIIGESRKFCLNKLDIEPLRVYVLNYVHSSNVMERSSALLALGDVGDERDVDFLKEIIIHGDESSAKEAVDSIMFVSLNDAINNLESVIGLVKDENVNNYISAHISHWKNVEFKPEISCTKEN